MYVHKKSFVEINIWNLCAFLPYYYYYYCDCHCHWLLLWLCPQNLKWSPAGWPLVDRLCYRAQTKNRNDITQLKNWKLMNRFSISLCWKWGERVQTRWSKQSECYWSAINLNCGWNFVVFIWGLSFEASIIGSQYNSTIYAQHPLWHIIFIC